MFSKLITRSVPELGGPQMLAGRPLHIVRHPRARSVRLRLDKRSGDLILTIPPRSSQRAALVWAQTQESWVRDATARETTALPIQSGMRIQCAGAELELIHDPTASRLPRVERGRLTVGGNAADMPNRVIRWLKREALTLLTRETYEFAAKIPVDVTGVGIGDPISRWGSCSSGGKIRYNWRLIMAPPEVRRATVAHEVAHRVHMNHSKAFHALVSQLLEYDPKRERGWLRQHGASLQQWGRASLGMNNEH